MIRFLKSHEIDKESWDACIASSPAAFMYAYSWYLDLVAPEWSGLIKGDYDAVMPLPTRKKLGITYVFQPPLTQQLGVFSSSMITSGELNDFLNAIPGHIKYLNYNLNFSNDITGLSYQVNQKTNYELGLAKSYEDVRAGYRGKTRRKIQQAKENVEIIEKINAIELVNLKRNNPDKKMEPAYYIWMHNFSENIIKKGIAEIIGAKSEGKLCAAALFVKYGNRIYYFIPVSDPEGRKQLAMFALIDHMLKKYSGNDLIFDFEGSVLPGIARFFAGFGAISYSYYGIVVNRLPWPLRLLKK